MNIIRVSKRQTGRTFELCGLMAEELKQGKMVSLYGDKEQMLKHVQYILMEKYDVNTEAQPVYGLFPRNNMKMVFNEREELLGIDILPQTKAIIGYTLKRKLHNKTTS